MIQRVQSVLLAVIVVMMLSVPFIPNWDKTNSEKTEKWVLTGRSLQIFTLNNDIETLKEESSKPLTGALAVLSALIAGFSISQFKKRPLQIKLGALISILIASTVASMLFTSKELEKMFNPTQIGHNNAGLYVCMVALLLNILSNRFIHRDERLVRSMDRIR